MTDTMLLTVETIIHRVIRKPFSLKSFLPSQLPSHRIRSSFLNHNQLEFPISKQFLLAGGQLVTFRVSIENLSKNRRRIFFLMKMLSGNNKTQAHLSTFEGVFQALLTFPED